PIQLRFSDTDRLGHVNHPVFATYAELGRLACLRGLGMTDQGLILARLAIQFVSQVRLEEVCYVVTRAGGFASEAHTVAANSSSRGSCGSGTRASRWSRR